MTAKFFVDTNVLLYAGSNAPDDQAKRQVARALLARPDIGFSAQVLQEFYAVAVTKKGLQMTHDEAVAVLQSLCSIPRLAHLSGPAACRHRRQTALWPFLLGRGNHYGGQTNGLPDSVQ